jgi:hypothetical protein
MVFNGRPIQNDSTDFLGEKASNASGSLRETSAKANQELDTEVFGASSGLGYAPYFDKFHAHNGSYPNMYQDNQLQGQNASNHNSNYNLRRWQGQDLSHGGHARMYNQTFVDMNALQTPMPSSYHPPHLQNPNYFHQATGIAPPNYGQQVATNDFQYATPSYNEPGIQPAMTYRNHSVTSAFPADQSQNASSCQDSDLSDNHKDAKLDRPTRNLLEHEKILLKQFYVMMNPSSSFQSRRKIQLWLLDGPVAVQNKWHSFLFANQTSAEAADRAAFVEEHRALLQSLKEEMIAKIKSERRGNRFCMGYGVP